jgi:SAM-dependent methyltransferase
MRRSPFVRYLVLILSAWLIASPVAAQGPVGGREYTPIAGQPGKDVVWLPSALAMVNVMLDLGDVTPQDTVIDLGSGDGRLVIAAIKRGARALGIEYNPDLVALSKRNAAREGVADRVRFILGDIFETDFSQATVITMFLLPQLNLRLRPLLLDLRPGTRIVSNTFTMGDWGVDGFADVTSSASCNDFCTALLWIVPAKVEGEWRMADGRLLLTQKYQMVFGAVERDGKSVSIAEGRLRGEAITFTADGVQYAGRVRGNVMEGTFSGGGAWSATRVGPP